MKFAILFSMAILTLVGCATDSMSNCGQCDRNENDMMEAENKQVVSEFFEHFSAGEIDEAFSRVSDDVSWWVPGDLPFSGTKSKSEYLQVVGAIQQGFPGGLQLDATAMIAEGNRVAVEVASYGEHTNGKTYTNKYHFLMTLEKGKIVDVKEYMDTLHLYQLITP